MGTSDRVLCTKDSPWDGKTGRRVEHEDAVETEEERDFGAGEYCVKMRCPNCGWWWWKELPQ